MAPSWTTVLRVELGRGIRELLARTPLQLPLSQLTHNHAGALQSVDLRYPRATSPGLRAATTVTDIAPAQRKPTR
jgi:hypothetical protein